MDKIAKVFSKVSKLYSVAFIHDIFNLVRDDVSDFKLNGYKSMKENVDFGSLTNESEDTYYNIYKWIYEGGNLVDKLGIARNIISLNLEPKNLVLADSAYHAIHSSFKIYQKQNIKQYIEVRNKISEQLLELQNKADKISESFVDGFKKSVGSIIPFFISVIVLRVVSKGDVLGAFTSDVTIMSVAFLGLSILYLWYSRWEVKQQLTRYSKFYNRLKSRYSDLLDESDIKRVLNDNKDYNENVQFIEDQKKTYTIQWGITVIVLFVLVMALYFVNNPWNVTSTVKSTLFLFANYITVAILWFTLSI